MKNLEIIALMFCLGLFLNSCNRCERIPNNGNNQASQIDSLKSEIERLNDLLSQNPKDEIIEAELLYIPTGGPKDTIPLCKSKRLYQYYKTDADILEKYQKPELRNFQASRYISFNYQELVNYFAFIEDLTNRAGKKIDGLRFYLGKYPKNHPKYPLQSMLFFNPTINKSDKEGSLTYAISKRGEKYSIIYIDDWDNYDNCNQINKSGFSIPTINLGVQESVISLEGQGGQISPPDNNVSN